MVDRGRLFDVSTDVCFVDRRNRVQTSSDHIALLPPDYTPGYWDVICQGGKENYDHVGNRRFRVCIENNLGTYQKAGSKHQRSLVVTIIVDAIQDSNSSCDGVGFVRRDLDQGRWYGVDDKIAREKVGHALRDLIKARQMEAKKHENEVSAVTSLDPTPPFKRRRTTMLQQGGIPSEAESAPSIPASAAAKAFVLPPQPEQARSRPSVMSSASLGKDISSKATKRNKSASALYSGGPVFLSGAVSDSNSKSSLEDEENNSYESDSETSTSSDLPVDEEMESAFQAAMRSMDTTTEKKPAAKSIPAATPSNKAYQSFMCQPEIGGSVFPSRPCTAPTASLGAFSPLQVASWPSTAASLTDVEKAYRALKGTLFSKPTLQVTSVPTSKPTSSSSSQEETSYDFFMKKMASADFLPTPIKEHQQPQSMMMMGAGLAPVGWKPPGDKSAEEAFQAFLREAEAEETVNVSIDNLAVKRFAPTEAFASGSGIPTTPMWNDDLLAANKNWLPCKVMRNSSNNGKSRSMNFAPPGHTLAAYGMKNGGNGIFPEQPTVIL